MTQSVLGDRRRETGDGRQSDVGYLVSGDRCGKWEVRSEKFISKILGKRAMP
ncbi:hypothetical protein [Algoriphagus sp.]|uniref:hypothetical protein n=1 Tax=Algoriphagus sp. TaxID=1872435 RepID=UPI003F7163A7